MEQKDRVNEDEDFYQRLSRKVDMISDGVEEQSRLLKQLEAQIKEKNK